jgi:hypothetical protein
VEALRHADPGLLVLHGHHERGVREAGRQHLLPGRRRGVREPVHRLAAGLGRARRAPGAADALSGGGRDDARGARTAARAVRPADPRAVLDGRGGNRAAQRARARGLRGARRLLRARPHMEGGRHGCRDGPDAPAPAAVAGRSFGAGREVRTAGAGRTAGDRGLDPRGAARRADQAADGSRIQKRARPRPGLQGEGGRAG